MGALVRLVAFVSGSPERALTERLRAADDPLSNTLTLRALLREAADALEKRPGVSFLLAWQERALKAEDALAAAEATAERRLLALVTAAVPLEVLAGQIMTTPYKELTADLQAEIVAAVLAVRAAVLSGGGEEAAQPEEAT